MEDYTNMSSAGQLATPLRDHAASPWTETPNWIFDEAAPKLDGAPLKVLLYITRRTRGFHRESDAISLDQFVAGITTRDGRQLDKGCGVRNRTTVLKALAELERHGYIGRAHGRPGRGKDATTLYFLRGPAASSVQRGTASAPQGEDAPTDAVRSAHPKGVQPAHPQKKVVPKQSSYDDDTIAHARDIPIDHEAVIPLCEGGKTPPALTLTIQTSASRPATAIDVASEQIGGGHVEGNDDSQAQAIDLAIGALSVELGDDTPGASRARAQRLQCNAALSIPAFLALLREAATRTRVYKPRITGRQRDGRHKAMHYLFAVLQDLIDRDRLPLSPVPTIAVARIPLSATNAADAMVTPTDDVAEVDPTWRAVLHELRDDLTPENYTQWFKPTRVIGHDEERMELFIGVPDAFHQHWLDQRLRVRIERAAKRVAPGFHLAFVVVDTAVPAPDSPVLSSADAGGVDDHDAPK